MQKQIIPALLALLTLSGVLLFTQQNIQQNLRSSQSQDTITYQKYLSWKQKFGKNTNGSEDQLRFEIFSKNIDFINQNNQDSSSTVILGLTKFADMTNQEYTDLMTSEIKKVDELRQYSNIQTNGYQSIDWIAKGAVTSVKDQDACSGCWAFATVGALEGLQYVSTGVSESLSNQQVISCTSKLVSKGCGGGNSFFGFRYTANKGIETEATYPYVSGSDGVTGECKYNGSKVVFQNKSQGNVEPNQPLQMNAQLQKQPLSVAISGRSIFFQLYKGGILQNKNCSSELDHQVTLVGYSTKDNTWTIKNSYGTGWGEQGFAKLLNVEGDGICGINMEVSYPLM